MLGKKYDRIADWWQRQHLDSEYGLAQLRRALDFAPESGTALDVGCGVGGRFIRLLQQRGFDLVGIDLSAEMIRLARQNHPGLEFHQQDICTWECDRRFEFILAWDSIFHLPLAQQEAVITRLCGLLAPGGVLIYTFGDAVGDHEDDWHNDRFYYSSIGIGANLAILERNGLVCKHLELDQWPENHVYLIAVKP